MPLAFARRLPFALSLEHESLPSVRASMSIILPWKMELGGFGKKKDSRARSGEETAE